MANRFLALVSLSCAFVLPHAAHAQANEDAWAPRQQAAIAGDLVGDDMERVGRAVSVAERLGPERMSGEVRSALISLLERLNGEMDEARRQGIPTNEAVNVEWFMSVARVVASLEDPRAISGLAKVANHGYTKPVAVALASFGERALPAVRDVIETPGAKDPTIGDSLAVLSMMVERVGEEGLSASARREIARIARNRLNARQAGIASTSQAIKLAVALDEPDLLQTVREFARDPAALYRKGLDRTAVEMVRASAMEALARPLAPVE